MYSPSMVEREGENQNESLVISIFRTLSPLFVFLLILVVVLLEIFRPEKVHITWEVITLLGLLIAIPHLNEIKRIWVPNVGGVDFQQDINDAERQVEELLAGLGEEYDVTVERRKGEEESKVQEEPEDSEPPEESEENGEKSPSTKHSSRVEKEVVGDLGGSPDKIARDLYSLLDKSPRTALAKLRMETEEAINRYLVLKGYDVDRNMSVQKMYKYMEDDEELSKGFFDAHRKVRELCNRAIHGEEVRMDDAVDIIQMGIDLLRYLDQKSKSEDEKQLTIHSFEN